MTESSPRSKAKPRTPAASRPKAGEVDHCDAFDHLSDAAYAVDAEGRVVAWNRDMERLTGIPASKMLGKDQYEYALPFFGVRRPMLADLVSYDDAVIRDNYPSVARHADRIEWEFTAPARGDGAVFWATARAVKDGDRVVGAVECLRDVTRRNLQYNALQASRTELESLVGQRLDELERIKAELTEANVQRRHLESEWQDSNNRLVDWVDRLERSQKETRILGNMIDHLQACRAMTEAYGVVARSAEQLFPGDSGFLAMFGAGRHSMEVVATWGEDGGFGNLVFEPDQCWSLRRGKIHHVDDPDHDQICQHVAGPTSHGYLCMPMNAHGEVLGMLHVMFGKAYGRNRDAEIAAKQRIATTLAEQFALSLSNLRLREILHEQSVRDQLTGLFNRRYMEETLDRELRRAKRQKAPLGVIMLDVDHFKRFNDTFGHETGDALLRQLGAFLQTHIRGDDVPCRYGGEEFILIMPGADRTILQRRGEELREGVERSVKVLPSGHDPQSVTISLGAAVYPDHASAPEALVGTADAALYRSKQAGRNRVTVADARV